jgi:2-hydroxy-3-oxopropionate reductase
MGPAGAGGFTKLANQVIVAINLTAIGEALTLGAKAGLDRERLIQALSGGMAGSRCLEMKGPQMIKGNFQPGFKTDLHYKDLGLIMEAARALQVPLPATSIVQELFSALRVKGRGAKRRRATCLRRGWPGALPLTWDGGICSLLAGSVEA